MSHNFLTIDPAAAHPEGFADVTQGTQTVAWAQIQFRALFQSIGCDPSITEPKGPLGQHWKMTTGQSATYLINLAIALIRLRERMTEDSEELFRSKIRLLLRTGDKTAFEELLVELEIGSRLTVLCSPISFEAMVPKAVQRMAAKPSSPDYGLKYRDEFILAEVTVWHWEAFAAWARLQHAIHRTLSDRVLQKLGAERSVRLELPVKASSSLREDLTAYAFCERIATSETGSEEFDVGCELPARITWEPLIRVHKPGGIPGLDGTEELVQTASGIVVGAGNGKFFDWSVNPCLTRASQDDALKSIRKSIDRKRKQAGAEHPFVLALSLANNHINWNMFSGVVRERLWSNPKYEWLSAIIEYKPERLQVRPLNELGFGLNVNPKARFPLPGAFAEGKMWHLPNEWFCAPPGAVSPND